MRFGLGCLLFFLFAQNAFSQTKIYGHIVDTLSNAVLQSASVSIYQEGMNTVENVALTDRYGKFVVNRLRHDKIYRIEFSYQGYQKLTKEFSLIKDEELDFGKLHLQRQIHEIEGIAILPPVRMNGDTVEFNADAFQLDTNAVIEDLIHKLPGMIVWGDGKITYNGKEIPFVKINGKEFFGSDKSIGLQNIAKDAVEKVQVYDRRGKQAQRESPMDPMYEMNVVLKEGKEEMVFGNIALGIGTNKRYENYLNMNYANKRTQSSFAYANNNTNKKLSSLDQLLKNTTYKGVGINADYHSDFNRPGINQQHVMAARYQHDFLGTKEVNRKSIITGNIFSSWDRENTTNMASTTVAGNSSNHVNRRVYQSAGLANTNHIDGNVRYELSKNVKGRDTRINAVLKLSASTQKSQNSYDTDYDYSNNQSSHIKQERRRVDTQSAALTLSANWGLKSPFYIHDRGRKRTISDRLRYRLDWNVSLNENDSRRDNNAQIENRLNPEADQYINRVYNNDNQTHDQRLAFTVSNHNERLRITNSVELRYSEADQHVSDINGNIEMNNMSLTHESKFRQLTYMPKIEYTYPVIERNYAGRFSEQLSLKPEIGLGLLNRHNTSTLEYRNIEQRFVSYLPKLDVQYQNNKYGVYLFNSRVGYQYSEDFPSINQLQPIYDDINPAYRYFGNPGLSRTRKQTVSGFLRFQEHKSQSLVVNFNTSYNTIGSGIRDSIVFAPSQQQVFLVNMAKDMYDFNMGINASKPFVIKEGRTFTFEINASSFWSKNYQYISSELQELAPTNQAVNFITYFTNDNKYQLSWKGGYNRYDSRNLTSLNHSFSSTEYNVAFSLSFALTKKLEIGSDVNSRFIASNNIQDNLMIWNANIAHRFTKGNNVEARVAVYDILNQNKGIYVSNGMTEMTTGHRNNLQQFFQLSLSYFPRKFGL